ncbi:gpi mannosyltransferase 2 [Gigaspora margarita]|uniref:Gpi mannosyltransferase 2 n=1 Tax=Gigaspora margarita TaxID=4874 RepID=A0A8H4ADV6_GIGMA|nr:gpi mannosyltransferase 2 [Gigaspora margarita]
MFHSSGQQRGPYAITACTNCRRRHAKCSEEATCAYCASHNLKCAYVKSGKKRGPKVTKRTDNVFESNFDEAANIKQEHPFTLTEYQFSTSIPSYFNYGQEPQQIKSEFSLNRICTDTNCIMSNSNTSINFSDMFFLPNNYFSFSSSHTSSSSITSSLNNFPNNFFTFLPPPPILTLYFHFPLLFLLPQLLLI